MHKKLLLGQDFCSIPERKLVYSIQFIMKQISL